MHVCAIVPPYVLEALGRHRNARVRESAKLSLAVTREMLLARRALPVAPEVLLPAGHPHAERRLVYDCGGSRDLPGTLRRREGEAPDPDRAVDEAYDAAGTTWRFFAEVFGRDSIDDRGMHLISSVHYGQRYDNAFWDGAQMVYGDGDGVVFRRFSGCLDVIAHELTHGVTQADAGLAYEGESGALNESISDVFGSLVKQWSRRETVEQADWLIGHGLLPPSVHGVGLRSLAAPGTAYDDPVLGGRDPQPRHMRDYDRARGDEGGVHVNSGIPNHAFYLFARHLGGHAWTSAGRVWYDTLRSGLDARCDFREFAEATLAAAERHGENVVAALAHAWHLVGVRERAAA
jgi:Zn-dependent metalloprotease